MSTTSVSHDLISITILMCSSTQALPSNELAPKTEPINCVAGTQPGFPALPEKFIRFHADAPPV